MKVTANDFCQYIYHTHPYKDREDEKVDATHSFTQVTNESIGQSKK